ncbi:18397_t:CDS:2, partial [Dentiscutata erythropus]
TVNGVALTILGSLKIRNKATNEDTMIDEALDLSKLTLCYLISEITKLNEETSLIEEKEWLFDKTLSHHRAQLERVLSVIQDVQSQIQTEQEQNWHILGADEEPDATPESI